MVKKEAPARLNVKKDDGVNLIILLSFGLLLRLYAFCQINMISHDGAFQYIPLAKLFYDGAYLQALLQAQLPLYPFLISVLSHITGNFELSGRLISLIFSLLAIFPLYMIAQLVNGPKAAFWATMLYLTNHLMLYSSVDVLKEGLLIFVFFLSVYCSLRFLQAGSRRWLFWTVVFTVAGALVSMITVIVLVALGLWLGYGVLRGRTREKELAYRCRWLIIALAGATLFFLVPMLLGWEFLITKKPYKVIEAMFYRWFVYAWPNLSQIGERCLYIVDRFIEKTYYIPLPFAGFGLWWKLKTRTFSADGRYLALLMVVLILIFFPNLYASGRYHLPAIFILYLMAGFGFAKVLELIMMRFIRYPRLAAGILILIIMGAMVSFSLQQPERQDKIGYKEVGVWLRGQAPVRPLLLTEEPRIAYYADGEYVSIPPGATPEGIVHMGKKEKADYLVMGRRGNEIEDSFAPYVKKGALKLILRHPAGRRGGTIYLYKMQK